MKTKIKADPKPKQRSAKPIGIRIDIETRSGRDLKKSGVYPYVEDPAFAVLTIGYAAIHAYPGGETKTGRPRSVDLSDPQQVAKFQSLLRDEGFQKHAFNAAFERVALSRWLGMETGEYLDPTNWHCSSIRASVNGVFGSLEEVARALRSPVNKDPEGKALIKLFSVPDKATGAFHETGPCWCGSDHTHAFGRFVSYCEQDVLTEAGVSHLLPPIPDDVQAQYEADQRINDRGFRHHKKLSRRAVVAVEREQARLMTELKLLTGLDNPNSGQQMQGWLEAQKYPMSSLAKDRRAEALDDPFCPPLVKRTLELKGAASLSSVAKHQAALNTRCQDGRIRGSLQFYGAHTGRECLTGDHEVLTLDGWVRLDAWAGGDIAVWNTNQQFSFQPCERVEYDYDGEMIVHDTARVKQVATPEHDMPVRPRHVNRVDKRSVQAIESGSRVDVWIRGWRDFKRRTVSGNLRVLVMTQADGSFDKDGALTFHFKKQRKIERCRHLLRRAGVPFTESAWAASGSTTIRVPRRVQPLWLSMFSTKTWGTWLFNESPDVFFDELPRWDGYWSGPHSIQYGTTNPTNAGIVQAFAHLSGMTARVLQKNRKGWNSQFYVNIWTEPGDVHNLRDKPTRIHHKGKVYCAKTPTGFFMVRRNGSVWITGNSGRGVQPQNLPRYEASDADRERLLKGKAGTDAPRIAKGSVRASILPAPKHVFLTYDYNAIEARCLGWQAEEGWVQREFAGEGKIYEATAEMMFGVSKAQLLAGLKACDKCGACSWCVTRNKGKVSNLALGYGGAAGALVTMGAADAGLDIGNYLTLHREWENEGKPGKFHEWQRDRHNYPALLSIRDLYRDASPMTVRFWKQCAAAWDRAALTGKPTAFGPDGRIQMIRDGRHNRLILPSGRSIWYRFARSLADEKNPDRIDRRTFVGKSGGIGHTRIDTHGGSLTENITQAVARDVLFDLIMKIEALTAKGWPARLVLHVHDEVVLEVKPKHVDQVNADLAGLMSTAPDWAPGLLVKGEGAVMTHYRK